MRMRLQGWRVKSLEAFEGSEVKRGKDNGRGGEKGRRAN